MLTEGVSLGAVQVPPEGQPIILFVEHQTTGGYPKIANVIFGRTCTHSGSSGRAMRSASSGWPSIARWHCWPSRRRGSRP